MKYLTAVVLFLASAQLLMAQDPAVTEPKKNAFEIIRSRDSISGGRVIIHQDRRIEKIVSDNTTGAGAYTHGYRVQVFSSNAQRTAKDEAFDIERRLREAFPDMGIYVSYSSPFWKVRIGNFQTANEAKEFAEELLVLFPRLKSTTYTVRDRIINTGK
ncbi:MAG: hypothetical protein BGP01_13355 [Paludibacter sp. 47-17]|nr:MAG: hypothetical protein ABS72_03990 [Paludibacter sp. SCN 50-10]OJX91387.1 MAG: hypothetical protein BGP01_13355 [Paludibacter sp. 47-17]